MQHLCHATTFHTPSGVVDRHAKATSHLSWFAAVLRTWRDALREAVGAHRQYEHLRFGGAPHDAALRQALGIWHCHK